MKFKNLLFSLTIIGLIFAANPLLGMNDELKNLKRMQMIFNHINPPEPSSAETFDRKNLETNNPIALLTIAVNHDKYLEKCKLNGFKSIAACGLTTFLNYCVYKRVFNHVPFYFFCSLIPAFLAIPEAYSAGRGFANRKLENYLQSYLAATQSAAKYDSKVKFLRKLLNDKELQLEFLKDLVKKKEFKIAAPLLALCITHLCNKERAPFGALASCFLGVNLYGSIALHKTLDKFYEENRLALSPKKPGRMEQILNQLQPPELLIEFNKLVANYKVFYTLFCTK